MELFRTSVIEIVKACNKFSTVEKEAEGWKINHPRKDILNSIKT